eukprot:XP_017946660.1 PREDICTED: ankyrin repeat and SOCS box protein 9 isoform X1 [Xenopus tropicalis]
MDASEGSGVMGQPPEMCTSNPYMSDFVSDWSPIHDASLHGRLLALNKLINQGYSVNQMTADRMSPLHEACLGGHPACVSLLLKHGAQVNTLDIDWKTPIFNACISGNVDCVNLLLQNGASPHPACEVASPIHEACKRGANANVGKDLESPLHAAARTGNSDLVKLLIDYDGSAQCRNAEGKRPADLVPPHCDLKQVFLKQEGPVSLMQTCRLCIRNCFEEKQHYKICHLQLPDTLKHFLLYR